MEAGGGAILAENENKDSPEMRNSILEWRSQYLERMVVKPTFSLEQWQDVFTTFIDIARKQQDAPDGPGRTVPVVFAVDSIMATASESEIKSVREDGHASRGYALAANLISRYMRCVPELIQDYPFTVAGTNHLKPGTDARGFPTTAIPGGKSVKFMETYEIEMRRTERSDIDLTDYGGLRVKITARKNSLGPSRKSIIAELLWWNDERDGTYRQRTMWDWHAATIELLLSFENAKGKKTFYNALMDICDIRKKAGALAYSKTLGISADDAIPFRQLGYELECRPDLLSQLHRLLGVAERQPFIPGMDYRTLAEAARARAAEEARQQYGAAENVQQLVAADITDDDDAEAHDSYGDDELPEV
jgi:RecA/RadA recombinase